MKKKIKKTEQKIADCDNIYDMIEILQSRIEEIETEHMQLIRKMGELNSRVDDFSTNEN
jgi:prefoldin subunit 5